MSPSVISCQRSVRLDGHHINIMLDRLDAESDAWHGNRPGGKRFSYRIDDIIVNMHHPQDADPVAFSVPTRELSETGMSFLHGGFVYPDTCCTIQLVDRSGNTSWVSSTVVRCRLVESNIHEVSVLFDTDRARINPEEYCTTNDRPSESP